MMESFRESSHLRLAVNYYSQKRSIIDVWLRSKNVSANCMGNNEN